MINYDNLLYNVKTGPLFRFRGSVMPQALMVGVCSGVVAVLLMVYSDDIDGGTEAKSAIGADTVKASQLWAALTATLSFLIAFRSNKAYARFWDGTTLLHQMWGEWFDAASCLFAFSHLSRKTKSDEVKDFRHTLIRLMSLCHGSALEEISLQDDAPEGYPCLDLRGLDLDSLNWLKKVKFDDTMHFNRVEVIIHMIQCLIVANQDNGVLKIPPPILSRVFQTLSRGQVNLANCKKITSTLFPFPYAQLISWLLIAFSILTPIAMSSILDHKHWAFVYTALPVFGLCALNLVACELEMPFGDDHNDLPLGEFQDHMNNSMLMLIRDESDLVPHVSKQAKFDYGGILDNISTARPRTIIEFLEKRHPSMFFDEEEVKTPVLGKTALLEKPPAPLAPPPPAPAAPIVANAPSIPPMMQADLLPPKRLDDLNKAYDELIATASGLSSQLQQSISIFEDLGKSTQSLSSHLRDGAQYMVQVNATSIVSSPRTLEGACGWGGKCGQVFAPAVAAPSANNARPFHASSAVTVHREPHNV